MSEYKEIAELLKKSNYTCAFTGAGISVESGIPPFRGSTGLWSKYDPSILDLDTYIHNSEKSWPVIRELFFDFFGDARSNPAHFALAELEKKSMLNSVITQNIDSLHQEAGSREVFEFHGNCRQFVCLNCNSITGVDEIELDNKAPICKKCGGLLKPDFIFFGEGIPIQAYEKSLDAARKCEVMIVIGTTGEIVPASSLPYIAKENGAKIIEINIEKSSFTDNVCDYFIKEKASIAMQNIIAELH